MHVRCKRTKYTEIHRLYEKYKHGIKALQFRKKKKRNLTKNTECYKLYVTRSVPYLH